MDKSDLLKYALENDMIDLDSIQNNIIMKKKEKFLAMHKYAIWQGKNGKWYTTLPDETKGRVLKKRTTRESIEDLIVEYYETNDEETKSQKKIDTMTLELLYDEWIKYKTLHTNSSSSIRRINVDWNTFYKNDSISKVQINKLSKIFLDEWAHSKIKEYDMTKTKYYNMSLILRQSLDYAVDCEYIDRNIFRDIKVDKMMFKGKNKSNNGKEQVFLTTEEPIIKEYCYKMHEKYPMYTTSLAILLMFELGCRVGELVALCKSDIKGNYISICKQEVTEFDITTDKYKYNGTTVVPYTKKDFGNRKVFLTSNARILISKIIDANKKYGYKEDDYLILNSYGRTHSRTVNKRLTDYCEKAGIDKKSSHKIRKTYVSKLIDANVNIRTVMQQVGHLNEKTTYGNYCFDRSIEKEIENKIESALS